MNLYRNGIKILCLAFCVAAVSGIEARASITWGDGLDYGLLFEGNGGNSLMFNNSLETGNVGIGSTGLFGGNGPGTITGSVNFSAANSGQYSNSGLTITGGVNYGVSDVTSALTSDNSLSQSLGLETGTNTTISSGGTLNASSGNLVNGNRVFTVTSISFANGTFTINGSSTDTVVLNVAGAVGNNGLNGNIVLTGGITAAQVIFNFTPDTSNLTNYNSDYTSLTGGASLTISSNGGTAAGVFLDPTGDISVNHSLVDGWVIGGDTHNFAFVSGGTLDVQPVPPPPPSTPEPMSIVIWLGVGGMAAGAGALEVEAAARVATMVE